MAISFRGPLNRVSNGQTLPKQHGQLWPLLTKAGAGTVDEFSLGDDWFDLRRALYPSVVRLHSVRAIVMHVTHVSELTSVVSRFGEFRDRPIG